jgi:hypothetical protein
MVTQHLFPHISTGLLKAFNLSCFDCFFYFFPRIEPNIVHIAQIYCLQSRILSQPDSHYESSANGDGGGPEYPNKKAIVSIGMVIFHGNPQ